MSRYGFHGRLLHVDLGRETSWVEEPPDLQYRITGGAGVLAARLLLERTPPGIDPLGPENLLIFANSAVSGYPLAGLVRHVVCAKSPLTGGIGETRVEGPWGIALKRTGYDALVFHGAADRPTGLLIEDGAVTFFDAAAQWGLTTDKATDDLESRFGSDAQIAVIGPAGENRVRFASIVSGRTHQAQRLGMGAVMGAKRLKAIVLKGGAAPPVADEATCQRISAQFAAAIPDNILASWQKERPGFAVWVHDHGIDAALDVNNFRTATFERVDELRQASLGAPLPWRRALPRLRQRLHEGLSRRRPGGRPRERHAPGGDRRDGPQHRDARCRHADRLQHAAQRARHGPGLARLHALARDGTDGARHSLNRRSRRPRPPLRQCRGHTGQ